MIDTFLRRHDVDVGKSLGLLVLAKTLDAFWLMLGQLLAGSVNIVLTIPIGLLVGVALWRHVPWSRTLLLVCGWAGVSLFSLILFVIPFVGTSHLNLEVGTFVIKNPKLWQVYAFAVIAAPFVWFLLGVLHSEKAQSEFLRPNLSAHPTTL